MMVNTIKITPEEKDLLEIRAKIFGYKIETVAGFEENSKITFDYCILIFRYNSKNGLYHVLIIYDKMIGLIKVLKEINLFKNNSMEKVMSEKKEKELTGIQAFDKMFNVLEEAKPEVEKCFTKGNKSASVRLRKTLKELSELSKIVKKQSLSI